MPVIYLSPSIQPFNEYVTGSNEQAVMNELADKMVPYLRACGIRYTRSNPNMTLGQVIRESNAAAGDLAGKVRGSDAYYYTYSALGKKAAEILAKNLKKIYPIPVKVRAVPTTKFIELSKTNAPAVLMEIAYHDNPEDAYWIQSNLDAIAANLVQGLCIYFGIPFISDPQPPRKGVVVTQSTALNIRQKPSTDAPVLTQAQKGETITVLGQWEDWYVVEVRGVIGYAAARYIQV